MIKRVRLIVWLFVALAVALAALLWWRAEQPVRAPDSAAPVAIGAPFTLTASDGTRFASSSLKGTPYVLFFGFTHCPDVCPTTLARLAKLRRQLGKGDTAFTMVFVTVDPERDSPAEMARYAAAFATPIVALTGSPAEIAAVTKSFGIYSKRVAGSGGDYNVDHTAAVLLFDRAGRFTSTIAPDESDGPALAKLARIAG